MDKNLAIGVFGAGFGLLTWTYSPLPEALTHYGPWLAIFVMAYATLHLMFDYLDPPIKIGSEPAKHGNPPKRPDYAKWDLISDFRLGDVACLWIDREPSQHLGVDETAAFRKLEGHVSDRTLALKGNDQRELIGNAFRKADGYVVKSNPEWRVNRNALLSLAVTLEEKPPFLYKKERVK